MTFCSATHLVFLTSPKLHNGAYWELLGVGLAAPSLEERTEPGNLCQFCKRFSKVILKHMAKEEDSEFHT